MTDMLEKLTQELFDLPMSDGDPLAVWLEWDTNFPREACRHIVLSVLRVLREPDEEMIVAGGKGVMAEWRAIAEELGARHVSWPISPANYRLLRAAHRAAIDAILPKEEKGE